MISPHTVLRSSGPDSVSLRRPRHEAARAGVVNRPADLATVGVRPGRVDLSTETEQIDALRREVEALRAALRATAATSSDDLLAALLSTIPDFVYFKDTERRFVRASLPFAAMFDRPLDEILGRRDEDLFPPEIAATTVPDDESVLRGESIIDRIEGGELETGERWVSTTKMPWRDADGRVRGLLGISRDITASKQRVDTMQREYQRALRLETLGRLAGGVAHDFNNLLMVILGSAEEMLETLPEDNALHGLAELIMEAGGQARGLTRQLLRFSRRESGVRRALRIEHVLADLHGMLVRLMPDDIEVVLDCTPCPQVAIDPVRLQQAVLNLALNARDAMSNGGRLTLGTRPARHGQRQGATLSVRDTGAGLDPALQARIFEPFVTSKSIDVGTGLGLTVVSEIIDEVDGHISFESIPDRGTVFHLWMPVAQTPAAAPTDDAAAGVANAETVLLVDDERLVRRSVARMLWRLGYRVLEAADAVEAVQAARAHGIDLVVSDVILRGCTGPDVVDAIRALRPGVPVLYISGFTDDVFQRRGIKPDALELLLKPFTHTELQARIEQLLARARPPG